jgi:hypothetical protein
MPLSWFIQNEKDRTVFEKSLNAMNNRKKNLLLSAKYDEEK